MPFTRRHFLISTAVGLMLPSITLAQPATASFGIIYASNSKMIRRIIAGASNLQGHVGAGESLLTVQQQFPPTISEAQSAVQAATGVKPAATQCAVVDGSGVIKDIILADPTIDAVNKYSLVPVYAGVSKTSTYNAVLDQFADPIKVVKAGTILKDGTVAASDIQTGGPIAKPKIGKLQ